MDEDRLQPITIVFVAVVLAAVVVALSMLNVDDARDPDTPGNSTLAAVDATDAPYPVDLHNSVQAGVTALADTDPEVRLDASLKIAEILADDESLARVLQLEASLQNRMVQALSHGQQDNDERVRQACDQAMSDYMAASGKPSDELP